MLAVTVYKWSCQHGGLFHLHQLGEIRLKILEIFEDAEVVVADLEVNLGDATQNAPTLCVRYEGNIIPLNTPDMRPILMNSKNAIKLWSSLIDRA